MEEPQNIVYGLVDPRTGAIRYVGQSTTGARQRLSCHCAPSGRSGSTPKDAWLRELHAAGLRPEITVLEEVASREALDDGEARHIARLRADGAPLLNVSGGRGLLGIPCPPERKAKIAASQRGVPKGPRPLHAILITAAKNRGRKRSPEAIAASAAAKRGTKHTLEARAKMSASIRAAFSKEENLIKLARAHGGRPFVDQNGRRYETISGAARQLGMSTSQICRVLKGQRKATNGYVFRYCEDGA